MTNRVSTDGEKLGDIRIWYSWGLPSFWVAFGVLALLDLILSFTKKVPPNGVTLVVLVALLLFLVLHALKIKWMLITVNFLLCALSYLIVFASMLSGLATPIFSFESYVVVCTAGSFHLLVLFMGNEAS
ncbi:MAG: hypothetical protein AAB443_04470 [Patescibacteria group bacterium]